MHVAKGEALRTGVSTCIVTPRQVWGTAAATGGASARLRFASRTRPCGRSLHSSIAMAIIEANARHGRSLLLLRPPGVTPAMPQGVKEVQQPPKDLQYRGNHPNKRTAWTHHSCGMLLLRRGLGYARPQGRRLCPHVHAALLRQGRQGLEELRVAQLAVPRAFAFCKDDVGADDAERSCNGQTRRRMPQVLRYAPH